MAERCELCGARWDPGASTCRDCGCERSITIQAGESSASMSGVAAAREHLASTSTHAGLAPTAGASPSSVPSPRETLASTPVPAASPPLAAPLAPAVPVPLPASVSQPLTSSSRRPLVLALALVAVGASVGAGLWVMQSGDAPTGPAAAGPAPVEVGVGTLASCDQLAALAGTWVFTTATTGARRKERLGVRGFYQLQITVDGCTARASLAKTGRTDRTTFDDDKIPRAEADLVPGEGMEDYGFAGTFGLRNEDGQGVDTRFVFALDGERLVGSWRQLGERWTTSGLYGVLEGQRDGDPVSVLPERSRLPCAVRCATPEDIGQIDAPSQAARAGCMRTCK